MSLIVNICSHGVKSYISFIVDLPAGSSPLLLGVFDVEICLEFFKGIHLCIKYSLL